MIYLPDIAPWQSELWSQITARHARQRSYDLLNYGDPAGYMPLRKSIAAYLGSVRAVKCDPEAEALQSIA